MVVFYSKNLIYNAKFDKTKFSALKMRVSASKILKFIQIWAVQIWLRIRLQIYSQKSQI